MHIGINGYFLGQETTGSGQYLIHLLRSLLEVAGHHRYSLFVPAPQAKALARKTAEEWGVHLIPVPLPVREENLAKLAFEQLAFPRACRRERVSLAHVPYFASPLVSSLPTVVTIHDLIPLTLPAYRGDLRVRLYTRLVAKAARRADAILTDSQASARDIVAMLGIPAERVHVVYLAAEERYRPPSDLSAQVALRQRLSLPERYILYLGGFDVRRNLSTLLQALARALFATPSRSGMPPLRLVLAGRLPARDTPLTPDPRRLIQELGLEGKVQLLGSVAEEDKPLLYAGAAFFVFPSCYEGFGLPPLEAMACGVPVVAANATSLPEIVGDGGLLVDAFDVEAWAAALVRLWTNEEERKALSERALAQAARFSWRRTAEQTAEVYMQVGKEFAAKGRYRNA